MEVDTALVLRVRILEIVGKAGRRRELVAGSGCRFRSWSLHSPLDEAEDDEKRRGDSEPAMFGH